MKKVVNLSKLCCMIATSVSLGCSSNATRIQPKSSIREFIDNNEVELTRGYSPLGPNYCYYTLSVFRPDGRKFVFQDADGDMVVDTVLETYRNHVRFYNCEDAESERFREAFQETFRKYYKKLLK